MRALRAVLLILATGIAPSPALAAPPALPLPDGADRTFHQTTAPDSAKLPVGPWADNTLPVRQVEGSVTRAAWRIRRPGLTTLALTDPIRNSLQAAGYDIMLDCAADVCGGFDFRFAAEVLEAPGMQVDLFDYRALTAQRGEDHIFILVSRGGGMGYVQLIHVTAGASEAAPTEATPASPLLDRLERDGHAILRDLEFPSGADRLVDAPLASLEALAAFLAADPSRRVVLVGHTDSIGALDANTALSRRRAAAVRDRLIDRYGVSPGQVTAEGAGYLAPVASNLTREGREANRRVEAVVLPPS